MSNPWLVRWEPRPAARLRLLCFPYAGVGASVFRQWQAHLPATIEMVAVQLPGRESRLRETPLRTIDAIVAALDPALSQVTEGPYAIFGHSMGAVLAWEVARRLAAQGRALPAHVFLSGRRSPGVLVDEQPLRHMGDEEFVAEIDRRYGGIPPQVAADRDIMALLLPGLRADMEALETHVFPVRQPLAVPLSVFGGMQDQRAPPATLDGWRRESSGPLEIQMFPGGHFYLNNIRETVVARVVDALAPWLQAGAAPAAQRTGSGS